MTSRVACNYARHVGFNVDDDEMLHALLMSRCLHARRGVQESTGVSADRQSPQDNIPYDTTFSIRETCHLDV